MYFAQPLLGQAVATLGEIPSSNFRPRSLGTISVLDPLTPAAKASVLRLQRAIDGFLNKLPAFNEAVDREGHPIPGILPNPIGGANGKNYDGQVGPQTAGMGAVAVIGAGDLLRQANASGFIPAAVSVLTDPSQMNFATLSDELAPFFEEVTERFDVLLAAVNARKLQTQSVLTKPPPIVAPAGISFAPRGMSTGAKVGLAALGLAVVVGTVIAVKRSSKRPHRV